MNFRIAAMRSFLGLRLLAGLGLLAKFANAAHPQPAEKKMITVDGLKRRYMVYVPNQATKPMPVVLALHGGHTWPGRPRYAPQRTIRKASQEFDATDVIWQFFKSCPPRAK